MRLDRNLFYLMNNFLTFFIVHNVRPNYIFKSNELRDQRKLKKKKKQN